MEFVSKSIDDILQHRKIEGGDGAMEAGNSASKFLRNVILASSKDEAPKV